MDEDMSRKTKKLKGTATIEIAGGKQFKIGCIVSLYSPGNGVLGFVELGRFVKVRGRNRFARVDARK